jgi:N-hydroxyarylamine O-acetyltransferase
MTDLDLQAYLDRIGFTGSAATDVATLKTVHRRHVEVIPYETWDVLMGNPVGLEIEPIFNKMVTRRRGGWCYEMNILLEWALSSLGFEVSRLASSIHRDLTSGPGELGNHLLLLVDADGPWIADVGIGDGLHEPVRLREGEIEQDGFKFRLEEIGGGWWRFHNHQHGIAPMFDFTLDPVPDSLLLTRCLELQTSAGSPFRQTAVLQRVLGDRVEVMRGVVRTTEYPDRAERWVVATLDEYVTQLNDVFGVDLPDVVSVWPAIEASSRAYLSQHPELLLSRQIAQSPWATL